MPTPTADCPLADRLPTNVALRIRDTAPPPVTMGSNSTNDRLVCS
jgi:hypothetical protein